MDYTLSDLATATRGAEDYNGFGGGAWWIIVLFLFAFMGNGFGMNGRNTPPNGEPVTEAGLCNAMNFNDLQNAVGRLSDNENLHMMQLSQGLSSIGYENLRNFADTQASIKDGNYALSSQLADCCCQNKQMIADLKYSDAMNTASINKNIDDKFAALEKAQLQQTITAQAQRINQLELAQQMSGVVRYPNSYTYSAGPSPFCGGCGNI
nr:hypothetical protein [uncultured Lachnoclostridium sp.]